MRFIESSSLWGNIYRHRFYIDGKQVAQWQFDVKFNAMAKSGQSYTRKAESLTGGRYRIIWESI